MNRLVTTHPTAQLPPRLPDGRTRMLFLTFDRMGWATYGSAMIAATAEREDIDAVHIRFQGGGIKRVLSAPVPGGRGHLDSRVRRVLLARWLIGRWLAGPLDLRRFDVVHIAPHEYAWAFVGAARRDQVLLSTLLDATIFQAEAELLGRHEDEVVRQYGPLIDAERAVFHASDLLVATSQWAAAGAVARFGVDEGKLAVVPFSLPRQQSDALPVAKPVNAIPRIAFVGVDWERKGGERLLRWHQQRWSNRAELHLCTPAPVPRAARGVVHHGLVPHDELLREVLPSMDLLVLPTTKDMSPWAVLEAGAIGLPVVSSAIGGISEMVVDGETGFLLAPDDDSGFVAAVDRLLDDPELRRRMGEAARRQVEQGSRHGAGCDGLLDRLVQLGAERSTGRG